MDVHAKEAIYTQIRREAEAVLEGEADTICRMATIACLLYHHLESAYWVGFYRVVRPGELLIGPYQGTLGCLRISFDRGVCGAAANSGRTVIVPDVRQFPGHIACDPRSRSEIVVPIFDCRAELIAVLDIDSDQLAAFDEVDQRWLEEILEVFQRQPREVDKEAPERRSQEIDERASGLSEPR
jgi:L-methionine (R)-S-oxide reductase